MEFAGCGGENRGVGRVDGAAGGFPFERVGILWVATEEEDLRLVLRVRVRLAEDHDAGHEVVDGGVTSCREGFGGLSC